MLVFTYKDSEPEKPRWVAMHNDIIYYLYMQKSITLVQYCKEFDKCKQFECDDVYEAIDQIHTLTQQTPVFTTPDGMDAPSKCC